MTIATLLRSVLTDFRGTAELTIASPLIDEVRAVATENGLVFSVLKSEHGWSVVRLKSEGVAA